MIPDSLFNALACGARAAVKDAWNSALALKGSRPDEIDHLYAMITVGVREIGVNWSPILRKKGISLRVTGVFCHQTPKAHYLHPTDGPKSPELGDLLLVHEHKTALPTGQTKISRRAVFIQAKMVDQGVPGSGKVDQYQEYLYEHWPDFELKGKGPGKVGFLSGQRNFRPSPDAGCYGLIERDPHAHPMPQFVPFCCGFPWIYSAPQRPIRSAGGEDAGAFIANMLYDTGRLRGCVAPIPSAPLSLMTTPNNHFDVTVEELLALTAKKTLRFKNKSYIKGLRGYSVLACFQQVYGGVGLLPDTGTRFRPSDVESDGKEVPPKDLSELDFDDGISLVLIETGNEADGG